ncbi:MAG: acetyltransferase [Microscillaceae bacterium]|nr:acetyltransferase [Microscillaceae bacterium]MDW8459596.1 acetyltransferase [Cytophagales bacterium]
MGNPVLILGASPLGELALDIFNSNQIIVYGFLDDNPKLKGTEINFVPVLSDTEDHGYLKLIGKKCEAFVAVDDNKVRKHLIKMLLEKYKYVPINAIHAQAQLAANITLGHGNFINMGVILNTNVQIGSHVILYAGALIDYKARIGDFVQIGARAVIGAEVEIEQDAFIGAGAVLVAGIKVGRNARIGAGSVVIQNVEENSTVFGNPAQAVKK